MEPSPSTGTLTSGGRRDPPLKRDGGASAEWSSSPRPSPSPATPELVPRPRDRRPSRRRCRHPLPPAVLSLVHLHPALYLPASILVLLTPARNSASLPAPPRRLPPTATMMPATSAVDATMEPPPEDDRPRATQSTSSLFPPPTTGGGRGAEHCALSLPGSCRRSVGYLSAVIPRRRHCRRGIFGAEAEVVVVARRGGSGGRGSGAVLMPIFFVPGVACVCGSNLSRLVWEWIFLA